MKIKKIGSMLAGSLLLGLLLTPFGSGLSVVQAAEKTVTIDATDYGADPTGEEDSTKAIQEAFAAAKEATEGGASSVTVEFPQGTYQIYKDYAEEREYHTSNTSSTSPAYHKKKIGILIEGQENLTLEGNDSLFMMHGNMMALAVVKSKNVKLQNFSWDFGVPTVSEMTVTKMGTTNANKPYTEFLIPECFPHEISGNTIKWYSEKSPHTGQYYWTRTGHHENTYGIVTYQPDGEMSRNNYDSDGPFSGVSSIEEIDSTHVRIIYNSSRPVMQKMGTVIELVSNSIRETAGAFIWESENVTSDHVNVHYMHGFGWLVQMSRDVYFRNCNLMPREGSGHITVSYADGIHAAGAAGELVIENCNFANTHDDPINLHGTFTRVENRQDAHTLTLKYIHEQQGGFQQFYPGDKVAFFTRDTLESTDNETLYTVDSVVSNPGENGNDLKTMVVKFKEELPENLNDKITRNWIREPKYVAENVTYTPEVTIKNCTFRQVPTRGILCTTRKKVLIEGNTFKNMSMATIFLSNDSDEWYESGPIRDMTIRDNVFYIRSIGRTWWDYAPPVYIHPVTANGGLPSEDNPIHKNITIEGNTFYMDINTRQENSMGVDRGGIHSMDVGTLVRAESVENLTIKNNKVLRMDPGVTVTAEVAQTELLVGDSQTMKAAADGYQCKGTRDNLYEFKRCKNVVLEGNTYDDGFKKCAVLEGTSESNITNKDADIAVVTSMTNSASAPVSKLRYESSNSDVLSIDANGRMTAKKAGKAEVFAYYEWNGEKISSDSIEIEVQNSVAPEDVVKFDGNDNTVLNEENPTCKFEAGTDSGKEITWSVEDFLTGGVTDAAEISADGTLTAKKSGIVWVRATAGISTVRKAVIISVPNVVRNPSLSITREDKQNYTMEKDKITVDLQAGDLYQETNTVKNLFLYPVPADISRDNLRTVIKVENMPVKENDQWDTASFLLYKDDDNYISVGKKSHYDGIATVEETSGKATETGGSAGQNALTTAYLGFCKKGNTVSVDFRTENGDWTHVRDISASMLGTDYKIGFTGWETKDRGKTVTFSEFRVGSGDASYEDLCGQEAIPFMLSENCAPEGKNAKWQGTAPYKIGDEVSVTYDYTDEDGDEEGKTIYRFTYENGIQTVTESNTLTLERAGKVTCRIYPVDSKGMPGVSLDAGEINVEEDEAINRTELQDEVTKESESFAKDKELYTEESAAYYQAVLDRATEILNDKAATQAEIDQALANLKDAKKELVTKTFEAARKALEEEIESFGVLEQDQYTEESWQAYRKAKEEAQQVLENAELTEDGLKSALASLKEAKEALVLKSSEAARKELESENKAFEALDKTKYTEESLKAYQEALENAVQILNDKTATPEQIDRAMAALREAKKALAEKPAGQAPDSGKPIPIPEPEKKVPVAGTVFEANGIQYKVLRSDAKDGTVAAVKLTGKKKGKLTIPEAVQKDGYTFKVTSIEKKAFQKNRKLKTLVIGSNVTQIGQSAFYKCPKLKTITFKGKKAPKIGKKAFKGISAKSRIQVPKKMAAKQLKTLKKRMKTAGVGRKAVYKKK